MARYKQVMEDVLDGYRRNRVWRNRISLSQNKFTDRDEQILLTFIGDVVDDMKLCKSNGA